VDTEGTDFEVLQSGTLKYAKTIVVELRKKALFVGEATQDKVEEYLLTKGFKKVEEQVLFDDPEAFDVYFTKI
jgi:SOS response regulatory protein OraA/RecX